MIRALAKSMKNAPTSGTTRKARGAGPKRATSARMFATAFAVVPSTNPMNPLAITAVGGGAFYLDRLDLGQSWYVPDVEVGSLVTVSYMLAAGGSGSQQALLDRSYTTFVIGEDVLSVSITGGRGFGYVSLDNVVVNNLPEPASAGLGLVALLGAAAARRRYREA